MSTVKSDKGIADRSMGFGLKALNRLPGGIGSTTGGDWRSGGAP